MVCVRVCVRWKKREKEGERQNNSGNQSVSDSLALSMLCQSDLCSCVCVLWCVPPAPHFFVHKCVVATQEALSKVPSCPSQHSQRRVLRGPPAGPHYLARERTRAKHTHQSVQPGAHYQTTNPRTIVNLWCQSDRAALTHLQR